MSSTSAPTPLRQASTIPLLLLILLIAVSIFAISYTLKTTDQLSNTNRTGSTQTMRAIQDISQLQIWLNKWLIILYQYQTQDNREEYFHQSSYLLDRISKTIQSLKNNNIALSKINVFHQDFKRISLSVKRFEKIMLSKNRDNLLIQDVSRLIKDEVIRTNLMLSNWYQEAIESLANNHQSVFESLFNLRYWQTIVFSATTLIASVILLWMFLRWWKEQQLIQHLQYNPFLDFPDEYDLQEDFALKVVKNKIREATLLRIEIIGTRSLIRDFGTQANFLCQKIIGERLQNVAHSISPTATIYQLYDQEWAMLFFLSSPNQLPETCSTLRHTIEKRIELKSIALHLSVRIGASHYPTPAKNYSQCMQQAKAALMLLSHDTASKRINKNDEVDSNTPLCGSYYHFFQPSLPSTINKNIERASKLCEALFVPSNHNRLELYYQPRVSSTNGTLIGCEALLRWHFANQQYLPETFLSLAESSGLIIDIGNWVIEQALNQWHVWHNKGITISTMAINISTRQLLHNNFVSSLEKKINLCNIPPEYVTLEITRSWNEFEATQYQKTLTDLGNLGVKIVLDDFLNIPITLQEIFDLPLEALKIDYLLTQKLMTKNLEAQHTKASSPSLPRTQFTDTPPSLPFTEPIDESSHSYAHLIIKIAKTFKLKAIAEGVESVSQKEIMISLGCDQLQGNIFGLPMLAADFEKGIRKPSKRALGKIESARNSKN